MLSLPLAILVTGLPIFALASAVEVLWRKKRYNTELSRKLLHVTVGTYAAFWPWFLSWDEIKLLALGALCALVLSRALNIYKSIHLARRYGTGEVLAAASVGLLPFITHNHWVFAVSMLHLSLADGLAAIIGTKFGKSSSYKIFGQRKSLAGTFAFWLCSLIILSIYFAVSGAGGAWPTLLWLPFGAALLENLGIAGTDNILVPVALALVLRAVG